MGRVLAIDWGAKRVGLAISDAMKIIANDLETINTTHFSAYIKEHIHKLEIDTIILGYPKDLQNRNTDATIAIEKVFSQLKSSYPSIQIHLVDERFTSKIAHQTILSMGMTKKNRQKKSTIDKISALILLQDFLNFGTIHIPK